MKNADLSDEERSGRTEYVHAFPPFYGYQNNLSKQSEKKEYVMKT